MIKINEVTTSAINTALRKVWYKICCLVKRVEILEESGGGGGGSQSLQQVLNVGNTVSNFGGSGNASMQSTNFISGRTLYLNNNAFPTIRLVDNANASNYLQIDVNTLNIDGTSYNWSSIVNPPSSSLAALPFTTDHLATTNNEYVVGDLVYYGGNVYRCIANNDSLTPDLAPAYWTNLGAGFPLVQQPVDWNSTSGNNQILNKPTIPAAQVNSDWNATSGLAEILNKPTIPTGTVTSVGLSMPTAFTVTDSPITGAGTLTVTGAGTASQYVRGDGTLANFPNSTGGGSSVNYYLNGSVNQGTFGGNTYYELSKTPVLGAGTDFIRTNAQGNGYIASFITDAGDPNLLNIPAGNWGLEFYFSASANGGTSRFYGELYKVSELNVFTLIASESANPEFITNGTAVDQYFTSIAVPQTTLLATDRLAIRIFVITAGRNITLHTENSNLSEVITTFSTGLTALNGLTEQVQNFATGATGTDFAINSTASTHTFNLPTASATNRGALSSADWTTFNGKQPLATNLTSLSSLTYASTSFVKMTAAGAFALDTNTYLTSVGTGTTNQLTYWSGTNTLGSLSTATYPSLTELSYLKGVTSSIQTQINNKFTLPSLTAGSILFSNGSTIAQDNANFFWNDTNNRIGIGTASPESALHVVESAAAEYIAVARLLAPNQAVSGRYTQFYLGTQMATKNAAAWTFYYDDDGSNVNSQSFAFNGVVIPNFTMFASGNNTIGGLTDVPTSILTLDSTSKGFLPPRMTTPQKNNITTPSGLIVYDTTLNKLCVRTPTGWQTITSS
jgi:hypothetical protein